MYNIQVKLSLRSCMNKLLRGFVVTIATLLSIYVLAVPALGNASQIKSVNNIDVSFSETCSQGFDILVHNVGTDTTTYFDNRQEDKIVVSGTITNSLTGKTLSLSQNYTITFTADNVVYQGLFYKLSNSNPTMVGRKVYDIQTGNLLYQSGKNGSEPNLCTLLN